MNRGVKNRGFLHCNFFPKNSRGQFFLMMSIIILSLIAGFATTTNSANTNPSAKFYYAGDELKSESEKVIDYCLSTSGCEMKTQLTTFTNDYEKYSQADNLYFIYGDSNRITFNGFQKKIESVNIDTGSGFQPSSFLFVNHEYNQEFLTPSNIIKLKVGDAQYLFNLRSGENFFYVISKNIGGDVYVDTNAN